MTEKQKEFWDLYGSLPLTTIGFTLDQVYAQIKARLESEGPCQK